MLQIRPSAFAGKFYPENEEELHTQIKAFLKEAKVDKVDGDIKALISPHAGYVYSGPTAAYGYKAINNKYKEVIVIGPSHSVLFSDLALTNFSFWRTPLDLVTASKKIEKLKTEYNIELVNEAHTFEHSIEVQLPFLQTVLDKFTLIPLLTGRISDYVETAKTLNKYISEETLVIISSDLSHYLPYEKAREKDKKTIERILKLKTDFDSDDACGTSGISILIELAKINSWKPKLLDYRNSGDTAGDKKKVVGYASIAFIK